MRSGAASALAPPAQRARPSVRPSPLRPSSHPPTAAAARVARRARLCALASTGAAAQGEPAVVAPPLSPATTAALPPPPPPLPSVSVDSFLGLVVHGVPWRPLAAWSLFLATALVLHDFLGLAAATFVLSYLGNSAVSLGPPGRRRALASAFFAALLLL